MWILEKPLLEDAINDIAKVIAESSGKLTQNDGYIMEIIYRHYDQQHGAITTEDDKKLCLSQRNALYGLYDSKTYEGQSLHFIREALMKRITTCPMCGIQPPSQLDHQMPRSEFKSLSVCRLNLVPLCGVCNNKKRAKDPSKFIHPYYDTAIRDLPFFVITIHSSPETHRMSWKFSVNKEVIANKDLSDKIENQIGVVKLVKRLRCETIELLSDILSAADLTSQQTLDPTLNYEYRKFANRRGMNDWHTVFLKALIDSPRFTIEEARVFAKTIVPANRGTNG